MPYKMKSLPLAQVTRVTFADSHVLCDAPAVPTVRVTLNGADDRVVANLQAAVSRGELYVQPFPGSGSPQTGHFVFKGGEAQQIAVQLQVARFVALSALKLAGRAKNGKDRDKAGPALSFAFGLLTRVGELRRDAQSTALHVKGLEYVSKAQLLLEAGEDCSDLHGLCEEAVRPFPGVTASEVAAGLQALTAG